MNHNLPICKQERTTDLQRQRCKVCWRPTKFNWHVPDEVWEAVVPEEYRGLVVCLYCFDEFARQQGVNYAPYLRDFIFVGDRASFDFDVVRAAVIEIVDPAD